MVQSLVITWKKRKFAAENNVFYYGGTCMDKIRYINMYACEAEDAEQGASRYLIPTDFTD